MTPPVQPPPGKMSGHIVAVDDVITGLGGSGAAEVSGVNREPGQKVTENGRQSFQGEMRLSISRSLSPEAEDGQTLRTEPRNQRLSPEVIGGKGLTGGGRSPSTPRWC